MPRKWTDNEEAVLLRCVRDNGQQGLQSASEQIGRSVHSCRQYYHQQANSGRWPKMDVPRRYDPDRAERFERMVKAGATAGELAKAFGVSVAAAGKRATEVRQATVTPDWTPSTDDDPDKVWARAEEQTTRDVEKHAKRRFATVNFAERGPVAIAFISDQHIRMSGPVALRQMREDAELVRDTPGLYAVLGGDAIDNHIVISQAMVRGGTKPSEEYRMFEHYMEMFGEPGDSKILAVISGNHDDWTIDKAGVDYLGRLVKEQKLHYSPFEVVLRTHVGSQLYALKCRHRYSKYGSSFNPTHKVKRLWEMGDDDFDIGVVCHDHEPSFEPFWKHGRERYAFRPGSYQFTSSYAETNGFSRFAPRCPTAILFPDTHEVVPFGNIHRAADYLTRLRVKKVA